MKTRSELLEECIRQKLKGESKLNIRYYLKVKGADEQLQNSILQELKKYDYEANKIKETKRATARLKGIKFIGIGAFLCMIYNCTNHRQVNPLLST